jgi:hypothetical protein
MKQRSIVKLTYGLGLCVLLITATVQSAQLESATYLRAQHRTVLQQWLAQRSALRLATETDCANKEGLAATRQENGRNYQPYYAVGDFNGDGHEDFAVALISPAKRSNKFAIAIFNGPFNSGRASAAFFTQGVDLSSGGLVVLSGNRLVAGVFQTDDCVLLRPRGRTYAMKNCM